MEVKREKRQELRSESEWQEKKKCCEFRWKELIDSEEMCNKRTNYVTIDGIIAGINTISAHTHTLTHGCIQCEVLLLHRNH